MELNELQSAQQYQTSLLGNSVFNEGSILAGMSLIPQGTITPGGGGNTPTNANNNIISLTTLTAVNSRIDYSQFQQDGLVDVVSTSTQPNSYSGVQFTAQADNTASVMALRFKIQRKQGTLYSIFFSLPTTATVVSYKIDGQDIKSVPTDTTVSSLVNTNGNTVNLSDGNQHEVLLVLSGISAGSYPITVQANPTYSAIAEGNVNFSLTELKAEMGSVSTAWTLAPGDASQSTGGQRVVLMRVTDGLVWFSGMARSFKQQDITITGKGTETLGLVLNEDVVTASMDSNLYDPTSGAISQFAKGSDRLHYTVTLTYNDPNAVTIFTLKDGKVSNSGTVPDYTQFNNILAKRTNDQSGSYRVSGFNLWSQKNNLDDSKVNVVVDAGQAYVLGYSVTKNNSTIIPVDKATVVSESGNESFYYNPANDDAGILDNQPVKVVDRVTANIEVDDEAVNRGATVSDHDALANTQVYSIISVYSKDGSGNKTTYSAGVDYNLSGGNTLVWGVSANGKSPAAGSTYYVSYAYTRVLTENKDYQVISTGEQDTQTTKISFLNMTGLKPIKDSLVSVDYEYFLAREDVLTLDKDGNFNVISGQPMPLSTVQPPKQIDPLTLIIGYILVFPNSDKATTTLSTVTRLPFSELQNLRNQVATLQYNLSQLNLAHIGEQNQDPTTLQDIFRDNFTTLINADIGNKDFSAAYNLANASVSLPHIASTGIQPNYTAGSSVLHKFAHVVTAPFTESVLLSQPIATSTTNVNEYQIFDILGTLVIDPESDSWVDTFNYYN